MIHVFVSRLITHRVRGLEGIREYMFKVCWRRWLMEPEQIMTELKSRNHHVEFQRERRMIAEDRSRTDFYVLADDDCLPETMEPCLDVAADILERHTSFAMLSWRPVNAVIVPWEPPPEENKLLVNGIVYEDDEVQEHVSVGGIRMIRKGAMTDWPPMEPNRKNYDHIHCARLRELGWRCGYFKQLRQLHIGRHYSTIINSPRNEEEEYSERVQKVMGVRPQDGSEGVLTDSLLQNVLDQIKAEMR